MQMQVLNARTFLLFFGGLPSSRQTRRDSQGNTFTGSQATQPANPGVFRLSLIADGMSHNLRLDH
jgi:hypothetical protein